MAAGDAGFPVNGRRLLANCLLKSVTNCGYLFETQAFEQ